MMSLTFGLFTQVSGSGPLGPLVSMLTVIIMHVPYNSCLEQLLGISKTRGLSLRTGVQTMV